MIKIVKVENRDEGNSKAYEILKDIVDSQTLLALSGGTSPDYHRMIVDPGDVVLGVICVVDERYGLPYHENSNELLLKNSGINDYADVKGIEYHRILERKDFYETARDYNQLMSELLVRFPQKIGVMGIGSNLHTAGIFPHSKAVATNSLAVAETVEDEFPQRITMTLRALGEFQHFVILAFGSAKQNALKKMLDEKENDMQKYPAIFYRKSFAKSYLITDQNLK